MSVPTDVYPINPPAEKILIQRIASFTIMNVYVNPFSRAVVNVKLFDELNVPLASKTFVMEGLDYQAWSNDDSYLITFITNEINNMPTI